MSEAAPSADVAAVVVPTPEKTKRERDRERGFRKGPWPSQPPFTVSRRANSHYYLVGRVEAPTHRRIVAESDDQVFPWVVYLARRWGPGVYCIETDPRNERTEPVQSFFEVPPTMAGMFVGENPPPVVPPPPVVTPELMEPEPEADPLDRLEEEMERVDRLKQRFAPTEPPPEPKPSKLDALLDALTNPATLPHVLQTVRQLFAAAPAAPNPPPAQPSAWERYGQLCESMGVSAETMLAIMEADLERKAAAELADAQRRADGTPGQ